MMNSTPTTNRIFWMAETQRRTTRMAILMALR